MVEEVPGVGVEFPSYVDDLHRGLYVGRRCVGGLEANGRRERMGDLPDRVSRTLKEVAGERGRTLAEGIEERLILPDKTGRRRRRGIAEKVKWLVVILNEDLDFGQYSEYRIQKARTLLVALDGVGSSKWGMSPLSWRQVCMGMIRCVTSWGMEVGWIGQREWRVEMEKLQYSALRKCTGAVVGVRKEYLRKVAAVESVDMYARGFAGRFLARTMFNPSCAGVADCGDPTLVGKGSLSLVGPCWRGVVATIDLGVRSDGLGVDWEEAMSRVEEGCQIAYSDGSRDELDRVAGGWCRPRGAEGSLLVRTVATVWDGEVAGMRLAPESRLSCCCVILRWLSRQRLMQQCVDGRG